MFKVTPTGDWQEILAQARALLAGESDRVANAANLSALLFAVLPDVNWVGVYFLKDGGLVVGPFQGQPACVRIALEQGVCGAAARSRHTIVVDDVDAFPGHIACDAASKSEIVVPLIGPQGLLGVLDVDSPRRARFTAADRAGLEAIAALYVQSLAAGAPQDESHLRRQSSMTRPVTPLLTVDVVIELLDAPGQIVLIERRHPPPGWALPGGFVDVGETVEAAAVREAREETGLEVELLASLGVYSDPARDARGHTASVVFVGRAHGVPRGGDDARRARGFDPAAPPPLVFDHDRIIADYRAWRSADPGG